MGLKKGDLVTVKDFSYSRFVKGGRLVNYQQANVKRDKTQFVVVDVDIETHSVSHQGIMGNCNNTIIQAVYDDYIVGFIEERFLTSTKHSIVFDGGEAIEISHESFVNLKRQLLNT